MISSVVRCVLVLTSVALATALGIVKPSRSTTAENRASALFAELGQPLPGLDGETRARFERGREVATRRFAPSSGLGPNYNAVSCRNCHERPATGGGASRYRGVFMATGGSARFVAPFAHHFTADSVPRSPAERASAVVHAPSPFFGVGLLAEVPAAEIARRADPNDSDGDGVSGKVNFERGFVGRFGRKAQMASLQGFVRLALLDHLGITTDPIEAKLVVAESETPVEIATKDADGAADPELPKQDLADLLAFVALLAPPAPDAPTAQTREGQGWFGAIGCATCHVPSLHGPRGPVPAYSDLLLHDMGDALADRVSVGEANGREFRTQPLWGVGAQGTYLHDGRAASLDAAIRAHGGEADGAARRYLALDGARQQAVVAFVRSLGGADRASGGLVPPGAPVPPPGEPGGPVRALDPDEAARFSRGRLAFDRDRAPADGLGGQFNGDACRSCHYDPVIGGAGPADVDVVRHAFVASDGKVRPPAGGDTMAHRFGLDGARPPRDETANLFERRQTPSLLGLGMIDRIDESAIRASADPLDRDADGIRGTVSVLADGRVGRFGWKAQMASLADFTADAFAGELGAHVVTSDATARASDGASSISISSATFADVTFFLTMLAPPEPARLDREDAERGVAAFVQLGCGACHSPSLPARDGHAVPLYSDLLIHDVSPEGTKQVPQGATRGFRTPPLWGVRDTAPYLHDGTAETLDAAIRKHDGEAARSAARYVGDEPQAREALLRWLRAL